MLSFFPWQWISCVSAWSWNCPCRRHRCCSPLFPSSFFSFLSFFTHSLACRWPCLGGYLPKLTTPFAGEKGHSPFWKVLLDERGQSWKADVVRVHLSVAVVGACSLITTTSDSCCAQPTCVSAISRSLSDSSTPYRTATRWGFQGESCRVGVKSRFMKML